MSNYKNNLLSKSQFTFLMIGLAIGPRFLRLTNTICERSQQDSWISATIALIYPIFVLVVQNYIISKHPKENLLLLNKKYFGNILGNIFNCIFLLQTLYYTSVITMDFSDISRLYIVAFLTHTKVVLVTILVCTYLCSKGLKTLAQISALVSYMLIFLVICLCSALNHGEFLNITPIMGSGFKNILYGATEASYYYTGFDFLLLYHPFLENIKDIKKTSAYILIISGSIWVWTVFITMFYLGPDIIPKTSDSLIWVFKSIRFPLINNFRYVAMFIWAMVSFRIIASYYFTLSLISNDLIKISTKKISILLSPVIFFLSAKLIRMLFSTDQLGYMSNIFVIFNVIFLSVLCLLVWIKSKCKPKI